MPTTNNPDTILAFDIGGQRTGVARAHLGAPFPGPLTTLDEPAKFLDAIVELCTRENAAMVVLGLPRGMGGQDTEQTEQVRAFGRELEQRLPVPVYWMDEALTSVKAEAELRSRGKPYDKGDIDALAATLILEDFIKEHPELTHG